MYLYKQFMMMNASSTVMVAIGYLSYRYSFKGNTKSQFTIPKMCDLTH